jgi:KUP system potassium uptake protein
VTALINVPLIIIDVMFVTATLMNFFLSGAWVPVLIGTVIVLLMTTWRRGMALLGQKTMRMEVPVKSLIAKLEAKPPHIVSGTAIFLTSQSNFAPTALLHNLKHNKMLHENNLVVSVLTEDIPHVSEADRVTVSPGLRVSPSLRCASGLCKRQIFQPRLLGHGSSG